MRKTAKTSGKSGRQSQCLFQWPVTGIVASGAGRHGWAQKNSDNMYGDEDRRVHVHARVCVHACVRDVFAIYDNNI